MIKKIAYVIFLSFFLINVCFAVDSSGFRLTNPTKFADLEDFLNDIPLVIQTFAGAIFIVTLLIGGISYMTSAGNEEAAKKAKNMLLYSLVGIVVVALSFPAVGFIKDKVLKESAPQSQRAGSTNPSVSPSATATTFAREYSVYPTNFAGPIPAKSVYQNQVLPDNYSGTLPAGAIYEKQVYQYMDSSGSVIRIISPGETDLYNPNFLPS